MGTNIAAAQVGGQRNIIYHGVRNNISGIYCCESTSNPQCSTGNTDDNVAEGNNTGVLVLDHDKVFESSALAAVRWGSWLVLYFQGNDLALHYVVRMGKKWAWPNEVEQSYPTRPVACTAVPGSPIAVAWDEGAVEPYVLVTYKGPGENAGFTQIHHLLEIPQVGTQWQKMTDCSIRVG